MDTFTARYASFCDWQNCLDEELSLELAKTGFYYKNQSIQCSFCGLRTAMPDETQNADPNTIHRMLSPSCCYVKFFNHRHVQLALNLGLNIDNIFQVYKEFSTRNGATLHEFLKAINSLKNHSPILECDRDTTCKICLFQAVEEILLPCRHGVSCLNCGKKLMLCPVCKSHIFTKLQVYL